jgi:hypothetical protein
MLIAGQQIQVVGERINHNNIKELKIEILNPEKIMKSDISDKKKISSDPLTRDPYEAKIVDVLPSKIEIAGDGVFLKIATPANTTVSYFNGIRLDKTDVFSWNPFKKSSVYLVETSDEDGQNIFLDIPAQYSSWNSYRASSGHKVNHGKKANSAYTECEHPIFGKILCLYTLEVRFSDYGINRIYEFEFFPIFLFPIWENSDFGKNSDLGKICFEFDFDNIFRLRTLYQDF